MNGSNRLPDLLAIIGVEVTQAIQYYRANEHLTDDDDIQPDNSVTLIAGKPAWVRVYLRNHLQVSHPWESRFIENVTGVVEISRFPFGFDSLPTTLGTLAPQPPGHVDVINTRVYALERELLNCTLNFIIPSNYMYGSLKLRVRVSSPAGDRAEMALYLNVTLQQTLRVRGIMIRYDGPASSAPGAPHLTLAAPTLPDLQTTAAWTLLTYPVRSLALFATAGTITWDRPLDDAPTRSDGCSPNWSSLNVALTVQRIADGNHPDVLYYGLLPLIGVGGCQTGGVAGGPNAEGIVMAHELGHICGLRHAPCNVMGDTAYPAYEPYDPQRTPRASIGEYGLDINTGHIMPPSGFKDLMSYCEPCWISLYHYGRLTNNALLNPVQIFSRIWEPERRRPLSWPPSEPPPYPVWLKPVANPEPLISVIGIVHSEDSIEIKSIMRLEVVPHIEYGRRTDLKVELLGEKECSLASKPLYQLSSYGKGCGGGGGDDDAGQDPYPFLFLTLLPDVAPGLALRIRKGEREIWRRAAPPCKPQIAKFEAVIVKKSSQTKGKAEALVVFNWEIAEDKAQDDLEKHFEGWLQWSDDKGRTWQALATGLRYRSVSLDIAALPPGKVLVRMLLSDGFYTAEPKSVELKIPPRPPIVSILSPRQGQTLSAGRTMRLWGMATTALGEHLQEKEVQWLVDGQEAGRELDVFTVSPPEGEHHLTLVVTSAGKQVEQTTTLITVKLPEASKKD